VTETSRPFDPIVAARTRGKYVGGGATGGDYRQREHHRRARGPPEDDGADEEVDSQSIGTFCRRNGISESFYFKLKAQGLGPREIKLGARVLITRESAREWRREREIAAQEQETPA
jgi:hypothetical protein